MYRQALAHNYHLYRKEFFGALVAGVGILTILLSIIMAPAASAINIGGPSDCDNNAIIRCGAHSTSALVNAYNSSAYVRGVYAEFGITNADMANIHATNVAGRVTKSGEVFVDGRSQPVATSAVTGGRQNMPGSTKVNHQGAIFYKRPPSVSFQQASLPAFVSMNNGRFQFAVIASCGNAVAARPTAPTQQQAVAPARPVSKPKNQQPAPPPAAPTQSQEVNVNNTNVNQNTQTQINKQAAAPPEQTAPVPAETPAAPAPQPATETSAAVLPNTGPTGLIGTFLAAVGLGTLGYRRLLLRRLGNN